MARGGRARITTESAAEQNDGSAALRAARWP